MVDVIELDRANLHRYSAAEQAAYCLSDARATRLLAEDLLGA